MAINFNDFGPAIEQLDITPLHAVVYCEGREGNLFTVSKINTDLLSDATDDVRVVKIGPIEQFLDLVYGTIKDDEEAMTFVNAWGSALFDDVGTF